MEVINNYHARVEELINSGYRVRIEYYVHRGFEIFRMRADLFLLYTLLYLLSMFIPIGSFLIAQPMVAGFFIASHYLVSGRPLFFESFFDGFNFFIQLLLFTLISTIFIFLGILACIIPGIYLSVGYVFTPFFIIFGKMEFWDAMELSRRLVQREWFSIFGLLIVTLLLNLLGLLAFGIGLLFTIPLTYAALYTAFDDIVGIHS